MVALHTVTGQAELPAGKRVFGKAVFPKVCTLRLPPPPASDTRNSWTRQVARLWLFGGSGTARGAGTEGQGKEEQRIFLSKLSPAGWP